MVPGSAYGDALWVLFLFLNAALSPSGAGLLLCLSFGAY